jgi:predicted branched-subunit amino acid permease
VAAAGIASALTYRLAGPPWHVLAGALCGLAAAWLSAGSDAVVATEEAA